jgi:hypothetical protein
VVGPSADDRDAAGLCAACRHARVQRNPRGNTFWRCARADTDPRFRRYPPLPVLRCEGHERTKLGETPPTESHR